MKREWFSVVMREMLNPNYALFQITDSSVYQPYSQSGVNSQHLNHFYFAGLMIGLGIYHQQVLDVPFTKSIYKHLLHHPVLPSDVESIDAQFAKSLKWIASNDIADLELDLTFR